MRQERKPLGGWWGVEPSERGKRVGWGPPECGRGGKVWQVGVPQRQEDVKELSVCPAGGPLLFFSF